jgi:hypothetical protein
MNQKSTYKRKVLTFNEREEIIKKLKLGFSVEKLAIDNNISLRTIYRINRQSDKLEKYHGENPFNFTRRAFKFSAFPKLEKALKIWFYQQRERNITISMSHLQHKALHFYAALYPNHEKKFVSSSGYIQKFFKRNSLRLRNINGQKDSADSKSAAKFQTKFNQLISEYTLEQIYNADECDLEYFSMPTNSYSIPEEKDMMGWKSKKTRCTLLACSNACGEHKLPLVFIHKYANPKCFKGENKNWLPVYYTNSKNAWMTAEIFEEWFHSEFVPKVQKYAKQKNIEPKAILFIDNCAAHPNEETLISRDGKIKTIFFPANTTSIIQPMDQGPKEDLKKRYKNAACEKALSLLDSATPVGKMFEKFNIKDVIELCSSAWNSVSSETLAKSWHNLGLNLNITTQLVDVTCSEQMLKNMELIGLTRADVETWFNNYISEPCYEHLSDDEIVSHVNDPDLEEDEDPEKNTRVISSTCSLSQFDNLIAFL